jgi:hypothetical protein
MVVRSRFEKNPKLPSRLKSAAPPIAYCGIDRIVSRSNPGKHRVLIIPDQRCSRQSSYSPVSTGPAACAVVNIRDIQETILVLVLLVDAAHESSGWRQDLVDEDEDGLLWAELDAFANNINELADGEVCGHEVLLLVDGGDVRLLDLLTDDLRARSANSTGRRDVCDILGYGRSTSDEYARPPPCASRRGARP